MFIKVIYYIHLSILFMYFFIKKIILILHFTFFFCKIYFNYFLLDIFINKYQ